MKEFVRRLALGHTFVAVVAAASCSSSPASTSPSAGAASPPPLRRIVVLGDSLAVSPSRSESFPAELQKRLDVLGQGWIVANAGVSGDTTSGGLRRFDSAVTADTRILVLELGANDGLRGIEIAAIERNLTTMMARAQARNVRVLLCGMETLPTHGWDYSVEYHRMFQRLAVGHNVPLVPFLLAGVALNPDLNGEDGFHPNAEGARRIAETVWPYLERLVQQESAAVALVR